MTREDVLSMPAGWELDWLVATRVLREDVSHGWSVLSRDKKGRSYWTCGKCSLTVPMATASDADAGRCRAERFSTDTSKAAVMLARLADIRNPAPVSVELRTEPNSNDWTCSINAAGPATGHFARAIAQAAVLAVLLEKA